MNFFEYLLISILAISFGIDQANAQESAMTTIRGADRPNQFPLDELAIGALSVALSKEREAAGTGTAALRENFGISSAGASNIIAVLDSQSALDPDPMARVIEYCAALSNVSSRADTLKVMHEFYAEDMAKERAKGAELLASLNSEDRKKLTQVLEEELRPSATKSELNFETLLEQTSPEDYRKSVCDAAK